MNQINDNMIIENEQINQVNEVSLQVSINAKTFKGLMNVLSCLVDECELKYNNSGMSVMAVDPAHVSMLEMEIPIKAFSIYRMSKDFDSMRIGLDIDKIKDILKTVKKDDILNMSFSEKTINISVGNVEASIKNIDCSNFLEPKIPALHLPGKFILEVQEFHEAFRQCSHTSDHLRISLENELIVFTAKNDSEETTKLSFPNYKAFEYTASLFPLDYLCNYFKALNSIDKKASVDVDMGQDYPLKTTTLLNNDIRIIQLLAPRIENDD